MRYFLTIGILSSWMNLAGQKQFLHKRWEFQQVGVEAWILAEVPGTVHQDLMREGIIEDIYFENNEEKYQWIEKEDWQYRCQFIPNKKGSQQIVFEGLDTYTSIYLEDSLIGETNNMFRTWRFDLGELAERQYDLRVVFHSPYQVLKDQVKAYPHKLPSGSESGDLKVSPFCRKAAYHFGWDWAPRIVTCGIFRSVYLVSNEPRIESVSAQLRSTYKNTAAVDFLVQFSGDPAGLKLRWKNDHPKYSYFYVSEKDKGEKKISNFVNDYKLWWPRGHGIPHLYSDTLLLLKGDSIIQSFAFRFGLRKVELVNEADSIGTSFYLKVNGLPVFAKGANYVPQDVLLPRVKPKQYKSLLVKAAEANMNMLRVWGGGVYEEDYFYELCDSLGLMIWQDFMFAGTMYPADLEAFRKNVAAEVQDNLIRLRKHPSIVLWCGNNEIEVAWKNWGWQKQFDYNREDSLKLIKAYKELFEVQLSELVKSFDPDRPYTPTSPLSNWGKAENFNHSSMHYWGVWHGKEDFADFEKNVGRFMVEYGFQSFPELSTLQMVMADSSLYLESVAMRNRQKSYIGNQEISRQIANYWEAPSSFSDFIVKSQKTQARALEMAISAHRAKQGHCMGSLLWQLNDTWPGPSWSIIDYYGKPKLAYDAVRKSFED